MSPNAPLLPSLRIARRRAGFLALAVICAMPVSGALAQDASSAEPLELSAPAPKPKKRKPAPPRVKRAAPARYMALPAAARIEPQPAAKAETPPPVAAKAEPPAAPKDAAPRPPAPTVAAKAEPAPPPSAAPAARSGAQDYCANVADLASQSLVAWQAKRLSEVEEQIKQRIAELDAKRAEYQEWFARQEEARRKTEEGVVAIFSKMRPDAAALQLTAMEEASAAAVLARLNPRAASTILNEMSAAKAARLTDSMTRVATVARNP